MSNDMERFKLPGSDREGYFADEVDAKVEALEAMLRKIRMGLVAPDHYATTPKNIKLIGEINAVLKDGKHATNVKVSVIT